MKKKLKNSRQSTVLNRQLLWFIVRRIWTLAFVVLVLISCSTDKHADHADTYTCPMHPTVISDKPGTCPVCGMDLVRKAREGEEIKITEDIGRLLKSPNESIMAAD